MLNPDFREFIESLNNNQVHFEACYAARVMLNLDGLQVSFIDLEHLKQNKRSVGRLQDLADLENLD